MNIENNFLIRFESERLGYGKVELKNPHHLGIPEGITVVLGKNGSGKTTLGNILAKGRYAYGNRLGFLRDDMKIKLLSFSDIHALSGMEVEYMAQRMESTMNDYVPTVADIVGERIHSDEWKNLSDSLGLHDIDDKKINYLSSGELRKLLIINALTENPDVIILDNPYIGLDATSRDEFDEAMLKLRDDGKSIVLLLCDPADIPVFTDNVLYLNNCEITSLLTSNDEISALRSSNPDTPIAIPPLPERPGKSGPEHSVAFAIRDGHVRYGDREILRNVNWEIKKGECWALTGPNGSGKSLLLSMVCADNPQGYANDIT
ncbi:MAG: ATP-binding cassette domain-containing protein, partial [Muribaculaceae bacterium]|nr:ATP-binding cassette domain-containing protein [Muribaculaceae bacterium]